MQFAGLLNFGKCLLAEMSTEDGKMMTTCGRRIKYDDKHRMLFMSMCNFGQSSPMKPTSTANVQGGLKAEYPRYVEIEVPLAGSKTWSYLLTLRSSS